MTHRQGAVIIVCPTKAKDLSNAMHASIGQNIKSHTCPMSDVRYLASEDLSFHLLTFPSHTLVLYWPYFSQLPNQLLSFSLSFTLPTALP